MASLPTIWQQPWKTNLSHHIKYVNCTADT